MTRADCRPHRQRLQFIVDGTTSGAVLPSDSYLLLIRSKRFATHLLSAQQQHEAYAFAKKGKDKAQDIEWALSELSNPLLANATAIIEYELWWEYEGGDHAILVGAVKNLIVTEQAPSPHGLLSRKMSALPVLA